MVATCKMEGLPKPNESRQTADGCNFKEERYKKARTLVLTAGPSGAGEAESSVFVWVVEE